MNENAVNFIGSYLPIFLLGIVVSTKWLFGAMFGVEVETEEFTPMPIPYCHHNASTERGLSTSFEMLSNRALQDRPND
jgi:hypothetical protein